MAEGRHIDLSKTPWNAQKIYEEATKKEMLADEARALKRGDTLPRKYKLQAPGEKVLLTGMRRHEDMNGLSGEVVGRVADSSGFLLVRVDMADGGVKQMRVQPRCCQPVRHAKDGRTRGAQLQYFVDKQFGMDPELAHSVVSGSRPVSSAALGMTGESILSGRGTPRCATPRGGTTPRASTPRGTTPRPVTPRGIGTACSAAASGEAGGGLGIMGEALLQQAA
eukprot:TRINITY_DN33482_c0_g1_i1.p1 TRINITY_DN33482_c0_g1~~TRINITY_DN33482_c0_g1_i1.p1  ORF type:complete len:223 (+),score=40.16 TRINITY_DN33482_c0_g1_i1:38-706(+)